jgi:hypothetical protein
MHHKNLASIRRMCKSLNIDLEETSSFDRLGSSYDILLVNDKYINPDSIPLHPKVIFGPQFWVFPEGPLVGPLRDDIKHRFVYNVLSEWNATVFREYVESLVIPTASLPFSVDLDMFKPIDDIPKDIDCLVYIKQRKVESVKEVFNVINSKNLKYTAVIYGNYKEADYINLLHRSKFMISIDRHESQGFALEEAMACNVPLLVFDAQSMFDEYPDGVHQQYGYVRDKNLFATSVPYWREDCGVKITKVEEFSASLDHMIKNYNTYSPRKYIEEILSDRVCMKRILDYFKIDIFPEH